MEVKQEPFDKIDEIKQEIIECEESKHQQCKMMDLCRSANDIGTKQESCEFLQSKYESKTEIELLTLLTDHCDLPTLKDESTCAHPSYLDQLPSNNKVKTVFESLKDTNSALHVSKERSWRYSSWSVGQNSWLIKTMDVKQETFDVKQEPFDIKQEPFYKIDEIKQEIVECEESKLEQCKLTDLCHDIGTKQESCDFVQSKTESKVLALLTDHCDLLTLKDESTDGQPSYLGQPPSNNKVKMIFGSLKDIDSASHVSKKRKRRWRYSWSVGQNTSRLSRKKLFNAQFGRCYKTCNFCCQVFLNKSQFLSHFISIHYVKKGTKICKRKFGKFETCRCKNCLRKSKYQTIANITASVPNEKVFQCEVCSKTFVIERHFYDHLKNQNCENECLICLKTFSVKSSLVNHLRIHTGEKPFKCEICSIHFRQKSTLKKHLSTHPVGKLFVCEICSKQFYGEDSLQRHLKCHTAVKPFKCLICSKQFRIKDSLVKHLRIHTGEKPFQCAICPKRCSLKSNLLKHLRIHTGEKPFKCALCSKNFTQKSNLMMHLRIHTGEKPFKCEICSLHFNQKSTLNMHLKIHIGKKLFKCEICSKHYTHKRYLKRHLNTHTRENPFKCEICSTRFTKKSIFRVHLKFHTEKKLFKCEICSKQFSRKYHLKRHLNVHARKIS